MAECGRRDVKRARCNHLNQLPFAREQAEISNVTSSQSQSQEQGQEERQQRDESESKESREPNQSPIMAGESAEGGSQNLEKNREQLEIINKTGLKKKIWNLNHLIELFIRLDYDKIRRLLKTSSNRDASMPMIVYSIIRGLVKAYKYSLV